MSDFHGQMAVKSNEKFEFFFCYSMQKYKINQKKKIHLNDKNKLRNINDCSLSV